MRPDERPIERLATQLEPLIERFRAAGHELYLVGGIVRDLRLGDEHEPVDVDLTTAARPDDIQRQIDGLADAVWLQGERFGTIGARIDDHLLEITTFREEIYRSDSRKPHVRFADDLHTDLSRRDFTINAMAMSLPDLALVDPFGGEADLEARRLRTPLDPAVSFADDPLRMLRAARFVARYGLTPDPHLVEVMIEFADRIAIVSSERIGEELGKLLAVPHPSGGIVLLQRAGLFARIGLHPTPSAGAAVDRMPLDDPVLRYAAFCYGSDSSEVDQRLAELTIGGDVRRRVTQLLDTVAIVLGEAWTASDEAIRRLSARLRADLVRLPVLLSGLGAAGGHGPGPRAREVADVLADSIDRMASDLADLGPPLDGNAVIRLLDLEPGPEVGQAMDWLFELRLAEGPLTSQEASDRLQTWWRSAERSD